MRKLVYVSLLSSVIFYNLSDQLDVSPFEKVLFISVVLTRLLTWNFAFIFFRVSNKFLLAKPSFFLNEACMGDNIVDECGLLLYC